MLSFFNNKKDVMVLDPDSDQALQERMVNDAGGFSTGNEKEAAIFRAEGNKFTKERRNARVLGIPMPWKRDVLVPVQK